STDPSYFPEYLWVERNVIPWDIMTFTDGTSDGVIDRLGVQFAGATNFRVGDIVSFTGSQNLPTVNGMQTTVLKVIPSGATQGDRVIVNVDILAYSLVVPVSESKGTLTLVYNKLVRMISEVTGVNNVQDANTNYTEVYALIPDQSG